MSPAVMLETPHVQQEADARTLTQADTLRLFDACQTAQESSPSACPVWQWRTH
jgi:hypothetical protein